MPDKWTSQLKSMKSRMGTLAAGSPNTMKAFGGLVNAATSDGELDKVRRNLWQSPSQFLCVAKIVLPIM